MHTIIACSKCHIRVLAAWNFSKLMTEPFAQFKNFDNAMVLTASKLNLGILENKKVT